MGKKLRSPPRAVVPPCVVRTPKGQVKPKEELVRPRHWNLAPCVLGTNDGAGLVILRDCLRGRESAL